MLNEHAVTVEHLEGRKTEEQLAAEAVDNLLVLPWNLIEELCQQLPESELVTAIPELRHWRGGY